MKQVDTVSAQRQALQLTELQSVLAAHQNNERVWGGEKAALSRQLDLLNDQLVRANERLAATEAESRRTKQVTL